MPGMESLSPPAFLPWSRGRGLVLYHEPRCRVPADDVEHGPQMRRDLVQDDAPAAPAVAGAGQEDHGPQPGQVAVPHAGQVEMDLGRTRELSDRKSTRLNSRHAN